MLTCSRILPVTMRDERVLAARQLSVDVSQLSVDVSQLITSIKWFKKLLIDK
jgi:hypothetical protein